jgi:Raf kinase inhibitor-like YbhB/YbcL family protein
MSRALSLVTAGAIAVTMLSGCAAQPPAVAEATPIDPGFPVWVGWEPSALHPEFVLESTEFEDEGEFPKTIELSVKCSGPNIRPELHWTGAPAGTESFTVTFSYSESPENRWLAFDIPADVTDLPASADVPEVGEVGLTSRNTTQFFGPCSLKGERFRLWFTVYALDTTLDLESGAAAWDVRAAGEGHVLGAAELAGYLTGPTE